MAGVSSRPAAPVPVAGVMAFFARLQPVASLQSRKKPIRGELPYVKQPHDRSNDRLPSMTEAINQAGQIRSPTMLNSHARHARPAGGALAVSADDIRPLRQLAFGAGVSLAEILKSVDLPPELLDESQVGSIGLADYFRILERLSIAAHDESWGLSTRPLLPGATGLVLSNLSHCTSLAEAMKAVANAYNLLHGGSYNRVEVREDCLAYIIDDSDFPYALRTNRAHVCFTMECVLIFLHGMLTLISSDHLHGLLRKVRTKRSQPRERSGYMDFWPAPIRWKSRHFALYYDLEAMSMPITPGGPAPSSPAIYRHVIDLIERNQDSAPRRRGLAERLTEAFDENVYSQAAVARRLNLSVATLRRRLQEEGQPSFRTLREDALNRAAKSLLAQRRHPGDIADELGFGDLRSFNRAFKRWNGITPVAYAQHLTSGSKSGA
jgi:AraC-like DNA-binding protein